MRAARNERRAAVCPVFPVVVLAGFCGMVLRSMIPGLRRHEPVRAGMISNMGLVRLRRKPTGKP